MIAPLKPSDVDQAWGITKAAEFYKPWSRLSLLQEIEIAPSLGLWQEGQLLAFLIYRELPDQMEVSWLATSPRERRKGLMERLFVALIDASRQKSEIWLEVHEDNLVAQKLYEKLGFSRCGLRPRYYDGQKAALLYSRPIKRPL